MERATFDATTSNGKPNYDAHHRLSSRSPSRRQVRFSTDENGTHRASHEELTSEMINDIWYTPEELKDIKHEVRSLVCRHFHRGATSSYCDRNSSDDIPALKRYDPQRIVHKQTTLRYVLQAQNHSSEPDFIRSVSRQFSVCARALAANQGFEDYCEVYDPLDSLVSDTSAGVTESHIVYADDQEQSSIDSFIKRKQEDHHRDDERTEISKRRRLSLII